MKTTLILVIGTVIGLQASSYADCKDCSAFGAGGAGCYTVATPFCDEQCKPVPGSNNANVEQKTCFDISSGNGQCASESTPDCGGYKNVICTLDEQTDECTSTSGGHVAPKTYKTCTR